MTKKYLCIKDFRKNGIQFIAGTTCRVDMFLDKGGNFRILPHNAFGHYTDITKEELNLYFI